MRSARLVAAAFGVTPPHDSITRDLHRDVFINLLAATDGARTELRSLLAAEGLTELGFEVLTLMHSHASPEVPPSVIADSTGILRNTVTAVLVRLEVSGLIKRRRSRTDRRSVFAELTPLGRKRCETASARYCAGIAELLRNLNPDELATFSGLLRQVALEGSKGRSWSAVVS